MWDNRTSYNGISVLPYDGGSYIQAPFEDITKEEFDNMVPLLQRIDITAITEQEDNTALTDQAACAGGVCEIK
jgi:ribonucleoside-diphosphate reductase alpha chain